MYNIPIIFNVHIPVVFQYSLFTYIYIWYTFTYNSYFFTFYNKYNVNHENLSIISCSHSEYQILCIYIYLNCIRLPQNKQFNFQLFKFSLNNCSFQAHTLLCIFHKYIFNYIYTFHTDIYLTHINDKLWFSENLIKKLKSYYDCFNIAMFKMFM